MILTNYSLCDSHALLLMSTTRRCRSLTWWDLNEGQAAMTATLSSAGRAVAATESVVAVGNELSGLSVWQFQQGCSSSIQGALAAGASTVRHHVLASLKLVTADIDLNSKFSRQWCVSMCNLCQVSDTVSRGRRDACYTNHHVLSHCLKTCCWSSRQDDE